MTVLVINPGSTSIKYTLFKNKNKTAVLYFTKTQNQYFLEVEIPNLGKTSISEAKFLTSLNEVFNFLLDKQLINSKRDIDKFGIRVVHGGHFFTEATIINNNNLSQLKEISDLAPLHNPLAVKLIEQLLIVNLSAPILAVFDTSFHQTIKKHIAYYALPREISEQYHIKKYGFHGIVCQSVLHQLINHNYEIKTQKIIICHLGGGDSITAILNGCSMDNSMGFSPMEGLMMISRAGDTDDGILSYLSNKMSLPMEKIINILNNDSGIYGITKSKDMKHVIEKAQQGDTWCVLAINMFVYRVCKYIFAYYGLLQGLDLLVFSGGIGEHSNFLRQTIINNFQFMGIEIDNNLNLSTTNGTVNLISSDKSTAKILIVKADEDEEIYRQCTKKTLVIPA